MGAARTITQADIDALIVRVELALGADDANLLRALLARLRTFELGSDDDPFEYAGGGE